MEKNTIVINRRTQVFSKEFEVNGDVIVPDIKPDILSIINSNGNVYVYREDIAKGRVRIDGNLDTYTIYLSDSGETRSIGNTLNFSESFEDSKIDENSTIKSKVYLQNIEAKALNERKISIKAILKVRVEVFAKEEVEIGIDFEDTENNCEMQKLQEHIDTKTLVGTNKVKTSIKEDISVDSSYDVAEILKVSVQISNLENKISINKVLAKADANVKILFLAEDGRIGTAEATIPVMSFIDLEGVNENQECDVQYFMRNMLFKINSKEMHSIACQIDFEVCLEVYENKAFDVVQDIYGIHNQIDFNNRNILVPINSNSLDKISISEKFIVEDVLNIYDVQKTVNRIKGSECELILKIYYEADSKNGLNIKEIKIPFIAKSSDDDIDFEIVNEQFTINGEYVDCSMEILCKKPQNEYKNMNIIENIEVKDLSQDEDYKMYMYFVKAGDTVWNIAKRFRVKMEDIIALNELENPDRINVGDRLFIMR